MCNFRVMDKLEKGKKAMNLIFTRLGSSGAASAQIPAFAGGAAIPSSKKKGNCEKKK